MTDTKKNEEQTAVETEKKATAAEGKQSETENVKAEDKCAESVDTEKTEEEKKLYEAEKKAADAEKKISEYIETAQRIQAEFENYRKRNNESVKTARSDGINEVLVELLPVLDNFERGIASVSDGNAKSGMELIYKQMKTLLVKYEVEEINAQGENFDPKYHHAIAQCEDKENANKIVEVFRKGYVRKEKVLRPSMVKVAQ